jgi:glycosyltransferase involved in cell wall biosynthesis
MANILSECAVFILPSFEEGFTRVLSEAMACALPFLARTPAG